MLATMIDPSKLNPAAIMELTELMKSLTPDQMMKMQSLMHNSMAGFNVSQEMMEFEKSLPAHFREKMARIMYIANGIEVPNLKPSPSVAATKEPTTAKEARMVILNSIAQGLMIPEAAYAVLFPED